MTVANTTTRRCPACRSMSLEPTRYTREFRPPGKVVAVELQTSRCARCGAEATSAAQHAENLVRLQARKAQYDGALLGEEIQAMRRRYGITQQQAARIFGKGLIAFSRYENESSFPDASTTKLLQLAIDRPEVMQALAVAADVELPLWQARCEDEQRVKLRLISGGDDAAWMRTTSVAAARTPRIGPFGSATAVFQHQEFVRGGENDAEFEPLAEAMA